MQNQNSITNARTVFILLGYCVLGARSMHVDAVLFDLFDTLLLIEDGDVYHELCLRKMYNLLVEKGINVPYDRFQRVYFDISNRIYSESRESLEEPHFNFRVAQTLEELGYDLRASDPAVSAGTNAFAGEFVRHVKPDKDATYVLRKLHGKYKLGLISNFAIPECGRKLLDAFELKDCFDLILISAEVNQRKPSPKIFKKALKKLQVDASRAVFVGDMLDLDVTGAKSVGMKTVLIRRKPGGEYATAKPDMVIESLTELLKALED